MKNILLTIWQILGKQPEPKQDKPVIRHWVRNGEQVLPGEPPPEIGDKFLAHHLRRTEPQDGWTPFQIE